MARFVIDASIAATWCFKDESTAYSDAVLEAVTGPSEALAPRLWAYEIRNVLLVGLRRKRVAHPDADVFLDSLRDLRIRLTDPGSYDNVFALANRFGLTVYDAAYLDLALQENLPLASLDKELITAARQCGVASFQT